jgi:O-succinylbenzoic acid--CoA ligase
MLSDVRTLSVNLGAASTTECLNALGEALRSGRPLLTLPEDSTAAAIRGAARLGDPVDGDVALLVPTSGSSGTPKVVEITGAALRASASAALERIGGPGRWLLAVPPTHIAGLGVLVRSLLSGTRPETIDASSGFRPAAFVDAARRLGTGRRYVSLVPTQLHRLLADVDGTRALASFDAVLVGGAATSPRLLSAAKAAGIRIVTTYGMTETCGGCVYDGVPLTGVEVSLEDGLVLLGGATLARGYRGGTTFHDGWVHTADLGEVSTDGVLTIFGRADDVAVTGGEKVALLAVQDALCGVAGIVDAAALAVDDSEWGQKIVAYVTLAGPDAPSLDLMRSTVREALGRAAVPRDIVVLGALPMLPSGKLDRQALRAMASSPPQSPR